MTLTEYPDLQQRSEEWYAARCGIVTASAVGALVTVGPPDARTVACPSCNAAPNEPCISRARKEATALKGLHDARSAHALTRQPVISVADNDTSRGLTAQLVAERITGLADDDIFRGPDVWRGIEHEPFALDKYAEHYGPVTPMGFMRREEKGWTLGYSPDATAGTDGLVEVKCPRAKTHLRTILADEVPAHHMAQLQGGLLASERKWIDFVSFCAGMPLFVKRVLPDERWFDAITDACMTFEKTAAEMVAAYHAAAQHMPATERIDLEIF